MKTPSTVSITGMASRATVPSTVDAGQPSKSGRTFLVDLPCYRLYYRFEKGFCLQPIGFLGERFWSKIKVYEIKYSVVAYLFIFSPLNFSIMIWQLLSTWGNFFYKSCNFLYNLFLPSNFRKILWAIFFCPNWWSHSYILKLIWEILYHWLYSLNFKYLPVPYIF